ncbi:hypothetical protein ARSEF1564_008977 [Beauveria bassiana]
MYRTLSTTSARRHLDKVHHIQLEAAEPAIKKKKRDVHIRQIFEKQAVKAKQTQDQHQQEVFQSALNKGAISEALTRLITVRNLSDRCVEWPEFHALLKLVNPAIKNEVISSYSEVTKIIARTYEHHREALRDKLQLAKSKIHITVDVWSSPNRVPFLAICAHFVDETNRLLKTLIALPELRDGKNANEQAQVLMPVLEEYAITPRLGYVTGDNHGSNDKLCRLLRIPRLLDEAVRQVEAGEETEVDVALVEQLKKGGRDSWRRIWPLGKLHNIAVHIRSDSGRYRAFEELAGRQLGLDNDTRWNSWYILINRAIELEQAMDQYTKTFQDDLRDGFLTLDDWQQLKDISHFLHPFYRATLSTEGDNATLDRTLKTMDVLIKHFEKSKDKFIANTHLSACLMTGWYALDKYYLKSDNSPAYAAALILNPSYRKKHISLNWRTSWHKRAFNSVKELWDSTYRDAEILEVSEDYSGTTSEPDEFDLLERDLDVIGNRFKDEYESYSNAEPVPYRGSVIDWWGRDEQRERYSRLSQMAIDILSIPPYVCGARTRILGSSSTNLVGADAAWCRQCREEGMSKKLGEVRDHILRVCY